MAPPLMPKATAVWLIENTALTFTQIAHFCGLHELEVQAIADEEVAVGMHGLDPVMAGALTHEEIKRCEADPKNNLERAKVRIPEAHRSKRKTARYTPVSKRQDRPAGIAWLVKNYPELADSQISNLIGTTKPTINSIRDRTHWNSTNITPQNPVSLGLCASKDLEKAINKAQSKAKNIKALSQKEEDHPEALPINLRVDKQETFDSTDSN